MRHGVLVLPLAYWICCNKSHLRCFAHLGFSVFIFLCIKCILSYCLLCFRVFSNDFPSVIDNDWSLFRLVVSASGLSIKIVNLMLDKGLWLYFHWMQWGHCARTPNFLLHYFMLRACLSDVYKTKHDIPLKFSWAVMFSSTFYSHN